jgi:serine/threonine protein kinase
LLPPCRHFKSKHGASDDKACPRALVQYYARHLVSALAYVHQTLRVVHRDLKPENVLLSASGCPKLVDFGTAKVRLLAASECRVTSQRALKLWLLWPRTAGLHAE